MLGFGQGEIDMAHRIIDECKSAIDVDPNRAPGVAIAEIEKKYHDEAERYGTMGRKEVPERYTQFWFFHHEIYEGKYMIEFSMHHINRQHVLAEDGWGLLRTKWILSVELDEIHIFREA